MSVKSTTELREMFDSYIRLNDAIITASMVNRNDPNIRKSQFKLIDIAESIVCEIESRDIYPNYLRYQGETFAINYETKDIRIVRSISMDDLEVIYRQNSGKAGV